MRNAEMTEKEFNELVSGDEITLREENDFISQYGENWKKKNNRVWMES